MKPQHQGRIQLPRKDQLNFDPVPEEGSVKEYVKTKMNRFTNCIKGYTIQMKQPNNDSIPGVKIRDSKIPSEFDLNIKKAKLTPGPSQFNETSFIGPKKLGLFVIYKSDLF